MGHLRDNIVFQGLGGRGIANYLNDNYGLGSDVGFDANGRLVATPLWSASGAYQHYWTGKIRSSATYGYLRINNTAEDPATNYHISNYASGNIIFQPSPLYLFGGEFIYATSREEKQLLVHRTSHPTKHAVLLQQVPNRVIGLMRGASAAKHEKMNASETLRAEERRRAGVRINACRCGTASRQTPRRTYRRSQEGTGEPKQLLRPTHL